MRKAVAIAPGLVMLVRHIARNYLLQKPGDILQQARFILDGAYGGGRSGDGHGADPLCETGFLHYGGDIGGDIVNAAEAFGFDFDFVSVDWHSYRKSKKLFS